ncbi:High-affinity branched-chain amino acid transport system permease protein LivH [Fundidesulfovibrio magnetotacticus]|uniref:High-affinity branched-chain amino acid transport system permease protein LivH n=1 Tax=Fundidesulfovibrio magnetotacticus TaxID=2730080 RepID=A0A6V8LSF4_9BACT|nr:branched-chain amino acid ABC transporter permease [Fundidesulfovibrio magnetotacticus]GFK93501.1 High-affinity branched-chain amino acid transport system permease protein LivH [Fundidesulfovibrio magnetotacticus]
MTSRRLFSLAAFAAALALAPLALPNDYYVNILILCCLNALIVMGLNMLMGYAGQVSLGHAAFFGLAAYSTAIATATLGLPVWAGVLAGVAVSTLVAWVIAVPTLKLHGHYLAMATLGFGIIVSIVFNEAVDVTGGPSGFVGIPKLTLMGYAFTSDKAMYALCAGVLWLATLVSMRVIDSRTGRALRAIHVSESAAQAMGIDIARSKRFVFVLSAVYAGVAGTLYAHHLTFVAPSSFGFHFSVQLITMVVLGGMASIWGAVAGAFFLTSLPEFLRMFEEVDILIYGGLLVACMMFMPDGLAGGVKALLRLAGRRARG